MLVALALAAWAIAGCSSSSGPPTGTGGHLCSQGTLCTFNGTGYDCDCGGGSWAACTASALQPDQSCDMPKSDCMSCSEGATIVCGCENGAPGVDAGAGWLCAGGGQACK